MFEERALFRFNPFYFKDGTAPKDKYFLVLKNIGNQTVIASLPSGQNYVPFPDKNVAHGCIDIQELNYKCYCIESGVQITNKGFSFPKNTFLYGRWVDDFELDILEETYTIENVDYEDLGKISTEMYQDILKCLENSSQIKRKFKTLINSWINQ